VDYRWLKNLSLVIYIVMILLLVAILVFGTEVRGAQSWFDLGFYRFQPAELAKLMLVIVLAKYYADHRHDRNRLRYIMISGLYTLLPTALIAMQPDMGSALVLVGAWLGMILVSGLPLKYLALTAATGVLVAVLLWSFALAEYQKDRIMVFLNPQADQLDQGYNVTQSIIAIGSGGVLGKGLGQGSQSSLHFLPEQHTDFIYAVTAEELGLWGSLFLLALLALFLTRTVKISRLARDDFGFFLALGIGFMLIVQIIVNIGMNLGILPVAGIPLPFISYGGNAMIVLLIMIGILQSIYTNHRTIDFEGRS